MRPDQRLIKLAHLLVNYSIKAKPEELISINGSTASEPLVKELYVQILKAGAYPLVRLNFDDEDYLFYKYAEDHQIKYLNPVSLYEIDQIDAVIRIFPDLNPHALTAIDATLKQARVRAMTPYSEKFFKRWADGGLRWVGSACPTPALAQEAHMSVDEYADFVFACGHMDEENPVAFWEDFSKNQQKICDRLNCVQKMRYVGQDTDLKFSVAGRKWINCDGQINFPDGEVFTGPVEDSVEGTIRFTYPGIFQGQEIEDIFLRFEKGKVVESRAAKGQDLLEKLLDTDEGARYVGEIAIGTNSQITRFTKNMLFDEKMGGTVHLAVGRGFPETGSSNTSAIHWDMLKDMRNGGKIYADGKVIYENGNFV